MKKGVLTYFTKNHWKTVVSESLFQRSCKPKACNFIKKKTLAQVKSEVEFIIKNIFDKK